MLGPGSWKHASWAVIALLGFALATGSACIAASDKPATLNIETHGATVTDAIKALFAGTGQRYMLTTRDDSKSIDLKLNGVTMDVALKTIADEAGLKYTIEDGVYIIAPPYAEPAAVPKQAIEIPPITEIGKLAENAAKQPQAQAAPAPPTQPANAPAYSEPAPVDYGQPWPPAYPVYGPYAPFPAYSRIGNVQMIGRQPALMFGGPFVYQPYMAASPPPVWGYGPPMSY